MIPGESTLGAVRVGDFKYRFIDQPGGWLGEKAHVDVPFLRFKYEFWRFVFVQQEVEKLARTALEYPPMPKGASFNLDAVKAKIEAGRTAMAK